MDIGRDLQGVDLLAVKQLESEVGFVAFGERIERRSGELAKIGAIR